MERIIVTEIYRNALEKVNMKINPNETETMIIRKDRQHHNILIEDERLQRTQKFKYLVTLITEAGRIEEEE